MEKQPINICTIRGRRTSRGWKETYTHKKVKLLIENYEKKTFSYTGYEYPDQDTEGVPVIKTVVFERGTVVYEGETYTVRRDEGDEEWEGITIKKGF